MSNPFQVLWYLRQADGPFPWKRDGRYPLDHERVRELAKLVDELGFYGALTVGHAPFIEISSLIPLTHRMRFLIPVYPGVIPPALLAYQARLFDELSGGRLLINQVNGTNPILNRLGVHLPNDERYLMSEEYFELFKRLYRGDQTAFKGKYFDIGPAAVNRTLVDDLHAPIQSPHTPVWGSGASFAGIRHAGHVLDTYLTYLHHPTQLRSQIEKARGYARERGRLGLRVGTLANIIVRETEEEAWTQAQWLLDQTGAEHLLDQINARLKFRELIPQGLAGVEIESQEIRGQVDRLIAGTVPSARSLETYPNIWSGPSTWSALDILGRGWGSYLVGSAEQVAARMNELRSTLGIDVFILAGWPLAEEAKTIARLLFPLLDLDTDSPILGDPSTAPIGSTLSPSVHFATI